MITTQETRPAVNVGELFFSGAFFDVSDRFIFNGIEFKINSERTHFDANIILEQVGKTLGKVSKSGSSSKFWSDFVRTQEGRIPENAHTEISGIHWVLYKYLLPILSYAMTNSIVVTNFLNGEDWADTSGFIYIISAKKNGISVLKYGRTWDLDQRMNDYKNSYENVILFASCAVKNVYDAERIVGGHLFAHGAHKYPQNNNKRSNAKNEWFTMQPNKEISVTEVILALQLWASALKIYDRDCPDQIVDRTSALYTTQTYTPSK